MPFCIVQRSDIRSQISQLKAEVTMFWLVDGLTEEYRIDLQDAFMA